MQDIIEHAQRTKIPLAEEKILQLFRSVCQGLGAMHNHPTDPVAHRDIKVRGGGGGAGSGGGADVWVEEGVEFYEGHCWEGGRGLAVLSILFTHLASQPYVDRRPR